MNIDERAQLISAADSVPIAHINPPFLAAVGGFEMLFRNASENPALLAVARVYRVSTP
jgi:hypothetical protein